MTAPRVWHHEYPRKSCLAPPPIHSPRLRLSTRVCLRRLLRIIYAEVCRYVSLCFSRLCRLSSPSLLRPPSCLISRFFSLRCATMSRSWHLCVARLSWVSMCCSRYHATRSVLLFSCYREFQYMRFNKLGNDQPPSQPASMGLLP